MMLPVPSNANIEISTQAVQTDPLPAQKLANQQRLLAEVKRLHESSPFLRHRSQLIQCQIIEGCLYLDGCLPSYFLKQLAQEALRDLETVMPIENRIVVWSSIDSLN